MPRNRKIFFIALVVFIASFFLTAVHAADFFGFSAPGYLCAFSTLFSPWSKDGLQDLSTKPVEYLAFVLSGIINPLFIATIALLQTGNRPQRGKWLRVIVVGLLPACWLYFLQAGFRPDIGCFLWVAAMLVALFAASPERQRADGAMPENSGPQKPHETSVSSIFLLNATESPASR
jgi:hypothetical protein